MRLIAVLALSFSVAACQSWSTAVITVRGGESGDVRDAVSAVSAAQGLRTCSELKIAVSASDVCFAGNLRGSNVSVAGFQNFDSYVVKIGFYASGGSHSSEWAELQELYKAAIANASPVATIEVERSGSLLSCSPGERVCEWR